MLDPMKPPSYNFVLNNWQLNTPIKKDDGILTIKTKELDLGYFDKYFYTFSDGSIAFSCPINGAHTPNSHYPRCELREKADNGDWDLLKGIHILETKFKIIKLPKDSGIIIGQVHGNDEKKNPQLIKLRWHKNNEIDVQIKSDNDPTKYINMVFGKYNLGEEISYKIQLIDGKLTVSLKNGQEKFISHSAIFKNPFWNEQKYYFKTGNYLQNNGKSEDNSIICFYQINLEHKY